MDFEQIKTFIRVIDCGSFIAAASKLGVTQSTVSARIKELELDIGYALFDRHKSGVTLTVQGVRFLPHAQAMMKSLRQARQEVAAAGELGATLAIGGKSGHWVTLLADWVLAFRNAHPEIGIKAVIDTPDGLAHRLRDRSLDVAIVGAMSNRSGFRVERLGYEDIVLMSARPDHTGTAEPDYIYLDWGADFTAWHAEQFPAFSGSGIHVNHGALGLPMVGKGGGACYLPRLFLDPGMVGEKLHLVPDAPVFHSPIFMAYDTNSDNPALEAALSSLKSRAREVFATDDEAQGAEVITLKRFSSNG